MLKTLDAGGVRAEVVPEAMVGDIYAAIMDEASMQGVVETIHGARPGMAVILFGQDGRGLVGNFLINRGLGKDAERSYMTGLELDDPYVIRQWAHPVGRVYGDEDMKAASRESSLYNEVLRSGGAFDGVVGAVVHRDISHQQVLEIRFDGDDAGMRLNARRILDVVVPHIIRAMTMVRSRNRHPLEGVVGDALLEFVPAGAFSLDANCKVRSRNQLGEAFLRRMDVVLMGADGVLHARDAVIDDSIKAFASGAGVEFRSGRRNLLSCPKIGGGRVFLSLHAVPPPEITKGIGSAALGDGWRSILILDDVGMPLRVEADVLWKTLGLTPAESDLAQSLLGGGTVGECAATKQASKQSMRNLLLSIMRKTDTHKQTQLVSLLTRLAIHAHV